jgi:hypothetical protein
MKIPDIKKILSRIRIPRLADYRTISDKAHHDWKIIIVLFMLFSLGAIAGNYIFFEQVDNGALFVETAAGESAESIDVVSKKNLEDTVQFFKEKQARLEDLKTMKPSVADPSL